jgi:hypothetical protein
LNRNFSSHANNPIRKTAAGPIGGVRWLPHQFFY